MEICSKAIRAENAEQRDLGPGKLVAEVVRLTSPLVMPVA
jgi:hypothetical protein